MGHVLRRCRSFLRLSSALHCGRGIESLKPLAERSEVEAQSPLGPAKSDRPELLGVGVHPVALDAEHVRDGRSVGKPTGRRADQLLALQMRRRPDPTRGRKRALTVEQRGDPRRDARDVLGMKPHYDPVICPSVLIAEGHNACRIKRSICPTCPQIGANASPEGDERAQLPKPLVVGSNPISRLG